MQHPRSTTISKVFAVLVLLSGVAAVPLEETEEEALAFDDQCSAGNASACALTALQLRGHKASCAHYGCIGYRKNHACQCDSSCKQFDNCCSDFEVECGTDAEFDPTTDAEFDPTTDAEFDPSISTMYEGNRHRLNKTGRIVTGWHETSPDRGRAILRYGFRPGHVGYCGGGIYFAASPYTTGSKAIGPDSAHGFKLVARIDLGRVKYIHHPSCMSPQLGHVVGGSVWHLLKKYDADSIIFNPKDGDEYVIGDPKRVLSVRRWR